MHSTNKTAYFDLPESQRFGVNQKILVQNIVNKEKCFVKAWYHSIMSSHWCCMLDSIDDESSVNALA